MSHLRTQIRDKIKTLLADVNGVNNRVYVNNLYAVESKNIPCLLIFTKNENIERATIGRPSVENRTLDVLIYAVINIYEDAQDDLDSIILSVEHKLYSNITLDNIVKSLTINSIEIEDDDERERPITIAKINCVAEYRVRENAVDTVV